MEKDFIGEHEISPLARFFPRLSPKAYERLKRDIEKYGQRVPIARHRGLIIDGVHRLRACIELGIEPLIEDLHDSVDPGAYASSENFHRRDLDKEQKSSSPSAFPKGQRPDALLKNKTQIRPPFSPWAKRRMNMG